ncbi:NAD(P)/FAD-dependent oxidoreductase [Aerococcaceae bacterium DSM 111020]|nr:NAD(P)/FAD-dependent oxidoreductase [Aerococcaceae bacterium DSM 111020]
MHIEEMMYDITIIGGGPVGLFATYYASLRESKVKLIESLEEIGGQPAHLFAEKRIYDIPGQPGITGAQLSENLLIQAEIHHPTIITGEEAQTIEECFDELRQRYYKLTTPKQTHYTRTIIIAAGNGAFSPRRLQLPEAPLYEGKSLHYVIPSLQQFVHKTVMVCGGGDSAIDWALALETIADKVYLMHRRPQFRAHEQSIRQLEKSSVEVLTPYLPASIQGQDGQVTSMTIQKNRDTVTQVIAIDELIVSYGFISNFGSMRHWDLAMERGAFQVTPLHYETSRPGIFAIGDSCYYPGKVKLIATGFGEAPQAVNGALLAIDPDANIAPVHSTKL